MEWSGCAKAAWCCGGVPGVCGAIGGGIGGIGGGGTLPSGEAVEAEAAAASSDATLSCSVLTSAATSCPGGPCWAPPSSREAPDAAAVVASDDALACWLIHMKDAEKSMPTAIMGVRFFERRWLMVISEPFCPKGRTSGRNLLKFLRGR